MSLRLMLSFFVVMAFLSGNNLYGQTNDQKDILEQLSNYLKIDDLNEKKYQLAKFNEQFNSWLEVNEIDKEILVNYPLKCVVSEEKEYTIYYYSQISSSAIDYELFVKYTKNDSTIRVHHFSEKVLLSPKSIKEIREPVVILSSNSINGDKFFEVSFGESGSSFTWIKYFDLRLNCLFEEIAKATEDSEKIELNELIISRLNTAWEDPATFDDEFMGIKRMKTLFSKDGAIKVCTYGLPLSDFSTIFYGAVLVKGKSSQVDVFELIDKTEEVRSPTRSSLTHKKWYGASYLDIVEVKHRNKKYYTLLGFKGHDGFVKTRVIDVLWFSGGNLRFGASIFKNGRNTLNRLIFKYAMGANMVLRFDESLKMIIMDNLSPSAPQYKGVYRFYGPDLSYNGFKFEKGNWVQYKDIDLRNPK